MEGPGTWAERSAWAAAQFDAADLGDRRRTRRRVRWATQRAGNRSASLPQQTGHAADRKAAYRWFAEQDVTHAAICDPHFAQTRAAACRRPLVFLVQDTTELNFSNPVHGAGLGPMGRGEKERWGLHQQNVLAVDPQTRRPLGWLHQPHHRWTKRGRDHDRGAQRRVPLKERASHGWVQAIEAIGQPPDGVRWVHVGDRGEDLFGAYQAARRQGCDGLIRASSDRYVQTVGGERKRFG